MVALPPGTLLQLMYIEDRLSGLAPGHFLEIGPGAGDLTALLLRMGWNGVVLDLDETTVKAIRSRFAPEVARGALTVRQGDFLADGSLAGLVGKCNLVISCMVIEHLTEIDQVSFFNQARLALSVDGLLVTLVPASPRHWGIEDEIAGHFRRYTREMIFDLADTASWDVNHVAGLTFPVSNLLLPLSNYLVRQKEAAHAALSALERTKRSGRRRVMFKTHFPSVLSLLLNKFTMLPLAWLQKRFLGSPRSLVLYFEFRHRQTILNRAFGAKPAQTIYNYAPD